MTVDPRITAALQDARDRQALRDAVLAQVAKAGTAIKVTAQSLPAHVPGLDAPAEAPATEAQLSGLLDTLLPQVLAGVAQARAAYGDRRLSLAEAAALATTVIGIVSAVVRDGAPLVKGASARALVLAIFGALYDRYITPRLPAWLRPFAGMVKASAVRALETLYARIVKKP